MKNTEIIAAIKNGDETGINALAEKYELTAEQAAQVAQCIISRNAHGLRTKKNYVGGRNLLVQWRGNGYLGSFSTSTAFAFDKSGNLFAVYGER